MKGWLIELLLSAKCWAAQRRHPVNTRLTLSEKERREHPFYQLPIKLQWSTTSTKSA